MTEAAPARHSAMPVLSGGCPSRTRTSVDILQRPCYASLHTEPRASASVQHRAVSGIATIISLPDGRGSVRGSPDVYANGMNPRLEFPPEEMRRMGYRAVDMIVEHLSTLGEQPVGAKGDPKELLATVGGPPPEDGACFDDLLADLQQRVLHNTMHVTIPA